MRKIIPLKYFAKLLLMVMLTMTLSSVHESAHAMQDHVKAADYQLSLSEISAPHQCPCSPVEQHKDYDGCDSCVNCSCHAPLTVQHLTPDYNPSSLDLQTFDPFKFIPEVYLSKFIPPQKQV